MTNGTRGEVDDEELIDAIRNAEYPYSTASRIAEDLPISSQAVGERLRRMADDGRLVRDKVSARGVVYMLPEESSTSENSR